MGRFAQSNIHENKSFGIPSVMLLEFHVNCLKLNIYYLISNLIDSSEMFNRCLLVQDKCDC